MRKKIVKALLLIPATLVLLLSTLALSGCHDDNDDVNMVDFYGKEVPCHLMSVDDMPEWLQKLVGHLHYLVKTLTATVSVWKSLEMLLVIGFVFIRMLFNSPINRVDK